MALEGTLRDFGIADIFQLIGLQKKTGVLTLKGAAETIHVLFLDGKIVYADSESKRIEDRLGTVLVNRRLITKEQLAEALEKQKQTLRRLGHILVNDGYISRQKMQAALYLQVTQILFRLFRWNDGDYKFSQEETIDYDEQNFVPIPPESILMEGMQMIDEWPIIEKKIRSFDMVFEKVEVGEEGIRIQEGGDGSDLLGDDFDLGLDLEESPGEEEEEEEEAITLSRMEAEIYELVDGTRTVREITYRSSQNEFGTCRTLYDLLGRNLIVEARKKKPAAAADAVRAPVAAPRDRHPFLAALGYLFFLGAALVSLATFWMNPVNAVNWFTRPQEAVTLIGEDITRMRLDRLDYAVQVYELQYGALPGSLEDLVERRFVAPGAIVDPWGKAYSYKPGDGDYLLIGHDSSGQADPGLIIHRPASQRPPAGRRGAASPGS